MEGVPEGSPEASGSPPKARPSSPLDFGKYRILRELGRGGMGVIHEALDLDLNRKVALKLMIPGPGLDVEESRLEEDRFLREAQLAARLKHPHIVTIYESGVLDGRRYIAMELVEGKSFSDWRRDGPAPLPRQVEVLRDAALAVHHAHQQGVLHRDLKPKNILVSEKGQACVTDFGLAKSVGTKASLSLTGSGMVVGTPAYMSPEQAQGRKDLDGRSDVYALGVVLYEILTGCPPFEGESAIEILMKAAKDPVPPPSLISKSADRTIENICLKALGKNREARHPTAEAFAADLTRWLQGERFRVRVPRPRSPYVWPLAGAAAILLAVGVLIVGSGRDELSEAERLLEEGKVEEALVLFGQVVAREKENGRARAGREKALAKIRERAAELPPKPPGEDAWKGVPDLLPLVDAEKDALSGAWARREGVLVTEKGAPARLEIPYRPPEEYDLRLVFTREAGEYCVSMILSKSGQSFIWVMEPGGAFGFERIGGEDFRKNPTSVRKGPLMEIGRRHTAVVQVRRNGLKAFLDGELVSQWKTDYSDVEMNPQWSLRDPAALGLGAWQSVTLFHRLEVREVTGKGSVIRPAAPESHPK